MRWIKHLTLAHCDEAISSVLEEHGPAIYGIYWLIIEHIAAPLESGKFEPTALHSVAKWSQICHCPPRIFRSSLEVLKEKLLFISSTEGDRVRITVPNILKYKDEYSKKSGVSPELNRSDREQNRAKGKKNTPEPATPAADSATKQQTLIPPEPTWQEVLAPLISETAKQIYAKYPARRRDLGIGEITGKVQAILKHRSLYSSSRVEAAKEYLSEFLLRLDRHCASSQWCENGGFFAKGLENWLAVTMHRYEQEPPAEIALVNGHGPPRKPTRTELATQEFLERLARESAENTQPERKQITNGR